MSNIIQMARKANLPACHTTHPKALERFAELVLEAERNDIATLFEQYHEAVKHRNNYWLHAANYVRARGGI